MKENTPYVTKSQLLDHITKSEFGEFRDEMRDFQGEMRDFRDTTEKRFNAIDKRLDGHDRRFDSLDALIRTTAGVMRDQFREDLRTSLEYLNNIDQSKVDKKDFQALKIRVDEIINHKSIA